jgi:hypothetical protein
MNTRRIYDAGGSLTPVLSVSKIVRFIDESACGGCERSARFRVKRISGVLLVLFFGSVVLSGFPLRADIPVPVRLTQPGNAAEAWNVIRIAVANAERLFEENRVDEIREQVVLMGPSLRVLAREGALEGGQGDAESLATAAFQQVNLLVRESMAGNLEGARSVFGRLRKELGRLEAFFAPELPSTEIHSCVDHPEIAEIVSGKRCPDCGKALGPRRFPYSVIYTRAKLPTIALEVKAPDPLRLGEVNALNLHLKQPSGQPVGPEDLVVAHSRRLHLLLVDETGSDFQHLAPEAGNEPGTFVASFVPASAVSYRAWVVAVPAATRLTESLAWTLPGGEAARPMAPPLIGATEGLVSEREGITVRLLAADGGPQRISGGATNPVRLHVSDANGTPLRRLEPLWNAFAHLSLVSWDFASVHQVHAVGGEILSADLRGGPDLTFKLHPPAPGWWRLYLQIRVDGRTMTFPLVFLAE